MVKVKILDEALKGGEPARLLLQQSCERRVAAQRALAGELSTCAAYIAESKLRMVEAKRELENMRQELDMMEESLEDLKGTSTDIARRSRDVKINIEVLGELEHALQPLLQVGDALQYSNSMNDMDIEKLQKLRGTLTEALTVCKDVDIPILSKAGDVLRERLLNIAACMKNRFLELIEITNRSVIVKADAISLSGLKSASTSLSEAGLLDNALRAIVAKFRTQNVASELRNAKVFYATEDGNGWAWEGARGPDDDMDLLEFDMDDLDEINEQDVEFMTAAPIVPNAAARALRIFDLLRNKLVGPMFSGSLANVMQSWISSELLPPSALVSSNAEPSVPADSLRTRIRAMSVAATVLQSSFRLRGAPESFKISVDSGAMESKVGAECRAQVLLGARRAIATFAAARHSSEAFMPCPVSSPNIPEESRGPDWFPFCIVSQAAVSVMKICESTWNDAREAFASGSSAMSSILFSAAREAVEAYGEEVPLQYSDELRGSQRLKVLFYNDCMMLGHFCQKIAGSDVSNDAAQASHKEIRDSGAELRSVARNALAAISNTAQQALTENMDSACRNGSLCAYGTITRIQRSNSLSAARNVIRELVSTFSSFAPAELAISTAAEMCTFYLNRFCDEILILDEIGEPECRILNGVLSDAVDNVESLMTMARSGITSQGFGSSTATEPILKKLDTAQRRVAAFREVLDSRMAHIVSAFRAKKYEGLIDRDAMERLIRAIFEESARRESSIRELDLVDHGPPRDLAPAQRPSDANDWNTAADAWNAVSDDWNADW